MMPRPTIIVTGASSGIGWELALRLADEGFRVVALARREECLRNLGACHPGVVGLPFDLRETEAIATLAKELQRRFPDIAILVNNAGVQLDRRLDDTGYADAAIADEIAVNLTAPILLTRALLPAIVSQKGMVVNIASALALAPKSTSAVYSATKAGLVNFSAALRNQVAGSGVVVCDVYPPVVDTPMTEGRNVGKVSATVVAKTIAEGMRERREAVWIGKTRFLPIIRRMAPGLMARMMRRS